jgi:HlyD family secretion protein
MRGKRLIVISILALSAALGGCSAAPNTAAEPEVKAAVPVETAAVTLGVVEESASLTGKFHPSKEVKIAPKINGKIAEIKVELGQKVNQGDVLFTLDQSDLQTALKQAQAGYASASANLHQTQVSLDQGLFQAGSALKQAQQGYDDAKREADRTTELYKSAIVSEQQMDQAKSALANAELALNNAKKALETAQKKAGLDVAKASVEQSRLSVDTAKQNLENATAVAPISGIVSAKSGSVGEFASPQMPIVTLIDTSVLIVKVNVSEEEISSVKVGDPVTVAVPSLGTELAAKIQAISPVMDQQAKAYPVEISVSNPSGEFMADMIVEVRFQGSGGADKKSLLVPRTAVLENEGKPYVFKVEGTKAVKQEIATGKHSSDWVEVTDGLAEQDQVVTKGTSLVNDGDEVAVQK